MNTWSDNEEYVDAETMSTEHITERLSERTPITFNEIEGLMKKLDLRMLTELIEDAINLDGISSARKAMVFQVLYFTCRSQFAGQELVWIHILMFYYISLADQNSAVTSIITRRTRSILSQNYPLRYSTEEVKSSLIWDPFTMNGDDIAEIITQLKISKNVL